MDRILFLTILFFAAASLFAFGKKEEEVKEPVNPEWTLCVTALDASALPPSRQIMGSTVARSLAGALVNLDFRFRGTEESSYYLDYAWTKSRVEAAGVLAAKRNERDLLLYKGEVPWKYRKSLKAIDEAIVELEKDMAEIDALAPVVEKRPVFKLTEENNSGTYPPPPSAGGEYRFCMEQKADAILAGSLSEYHGRIYLNIKMYTLHTNSYSFEDSVLFSSVDLNEAMDEVSGRLAAAVSGIPPSGILIHASPPEAIVLIDNSFAASGEVYTHSPGSAELELRADTYIPVTVPLELNAGELAELYIDLTPLGLAAFTALVPDSPGSRVYRGSLYEGEPPLSLQLPVTQFAYISVETPDGKTGSVVYRDNELVRGSAHFDRTSDSAGTAIFNTRIPVSPEEKRVDRARRGFYGAYGAFWFILPAALLTAGVAGTYIEANNYAAANGIFDPSSYTRRKIYNDAVRGQTAQRVAYGVMGVSLGVSLFMIGRYLYISRGDAAPIVKAPAKTKTDEKETAP